MRKVAIIGRCANTRADAPFDDPEWEVWGLAWDPLMRADRLFEMHENWREQDLNLRTGVSDRLEWMRNSGVPVIMQKEEEDIPNSVAYPLTDVAKIPGVRKRGQPYIECSIAYMLLLALHEGAAQIGIWGVDLDTEGEYAYQRPNLEYLIAICEARGTPVFVPPASALFTSCFGTRYGVAA